VDDEEKVRRVLTKMLKRLGHRPRHATDGIDGLQQVAHDPPDLILLDLEMPQMNGPRFLEELELFEEVAGNIAFALHGIESDRKREESENRLAVITESSADAIFVANKEGNYIYANRAAEVLLGYSADELTKMSIMDVTPKDRLPGIRKKFGHLLNGSKLLEEMDLLRKDGTTIAVEFNGILLPDGNVYGSCRDLTERKQLQARIAQTDRLASIPGDSQRWQALPGFFKSAGERGPCHRRGRRGKQRDPGANMAGGEEAFAEVRDTGRGISADHLSRLFEPFFSTKEVGIGTGLGLSISKNIVEEYGGSIEVDSELGKGTTFVVRLPVREKGVNVNKSLAPDAPAESVSRGRILIIDDEKAVRASMVRMLKRHDVVEAGSGEAGRVMLETDRAFDLVLCDVMMPSLSGVELHEWLVQIDPDLAKKVVFVTGGAFTPRARDYLNKVGNHRLEKPFDIAEFRRTVDELVLKGNRVR
jgi:PAS domain S-box-containing protein